MHCEPERARAGSPIGTNNLSVALAHSFRADYGLLEKSVAAPELPDTNISNVAQLAVRDLFLAWGLDKERVGSREWNPLGEWIKPGARVVIKPNWVLDHNKSGQGLECLLTHTTIIEAILDYVILARPREVIIGDAPVQGCDFDALSRKCNFSAFESRDQRTGIPIRVCDLSAKWSHPSRRIASKAIERSPTDYIVFDLMQESLVEGLMDTTPELRVTMYNPDDLRATHQPGKHEYLIAREAIEADVIVNVAKLKCHKKAGITGALKNLVGINGSKAYLPHHRKGGSLTGGDCYPGNGLLKQAAEEMLDFANMRREKLSGKISDVLAKGICRVSTYLGADDNIDGSWHGNDTVWRMCLDLHRIAYHGRSDGTLAETRQRTVINVTDAIIAGQGEGPLAPDPIGLGVLTGSTDAAAAEWVHALLMSFDPRKVPIIREAFKDFKYPIVFGRPEDIYVMAGGKSLSQSEASQLYKKNFVPPRGWFGHCECT